MQIYLLDTCIWSYWFNPRAPQHERVLQHAERFEQASRIGMSVITCGELEFGWGWQGNVEASYRRFLVARKPKIFDIDRHTAAEYGQLKALLLRKYPPWGKRGGPPCRLSQLVDPVTSEELGIDENDLWIAAQAIVRNLVLVTNDRLARIREVAADRLQIENWAKLGPNGPGSCRQAAAKQGPAYDLHGNGGAVPRRRPRPDKKALAGARPPRRC